MANTLEDILDLIMQICEFVFNLGFICSEWNYTGKTSLEFVEFLLISSLY